MRASSSSSRPWSGDTSAGGSPAAREARKRSSKAALAGRRRSERNSSTALGSGEGAGPASEGGGAAPGGGRGGPRSRPRQPRTQRGLEPLERRLDRLGLLRLQPALQRRRGGGDHRLRVLGELVEPGRDRLARAPALELGERRVHRQRELQRRFAPSALIEVEPRPQP